MHAACVPVTCSPQWQRRAERLSFLHHGAVTRLPRGRRSRSDASAHYRGVCAEHSSRQPSAPQLSVHVSILSSSGRERPRRVAVVLLKWKLSRSFSTQPRLPGSSPFLFTRLSFPGTRGASYAHNAIALVTRTAPWQVLPGSPWVCPCSFPFKTHDTRKHRLSHDLAVFPGA